MPDEGNVLERGRTGTARMKKHCLAGIFCFFCAVSAAFIPAFPAAAAADSGSTVPEEKGDGGGGKAVGKTARQTAGGEAPSAEEKEGADGKKTEKRPSVKVVRTGRRGGSTASSLEMEYRFLPLGQLSYETVDSICRPWLSRDGGILVYEKARESVLVYDVPAVIERISGFIRSAQPEECNIRVTVDFIGASAVSGGGLLLRPPAGEHLFPRRRPGEDAFSSLPFQRKPDFPGDSAAVRRFFPSSGGAAAAWGGPVPAPPPGKKPDFSLKRLGGGTFSANSMMLMTGNGLPATLWKGETVVDPAWLQAQTLVPDLFIAAGDRILIVQRNGLENLRMLDVGARLMIRPFYSETTGNVTLELYPSLTYLDPGTGKECSVKVQSLASTVVVREGQPVYLGSVFEGKQGGLSELFDPLLFRSGSGFSLTDIVVTCEVLKPGDPRNARRSSFPASRR